MKKEHLPNLLTLCRIALSFCLLFLPYQNFWFVLLYLICGLTDILDGYLARRLKAETRLGAQLDSLADLCMCVMIFLTIIRQVHAGLPIIIAFSAIFIFRIGNALFSKFKFGYFLSVHTIANKVVGLFLFFCPLAYAFSGNILLFITGISAVLASVEEFLILFQSDVCDINKKSIFTF